VLETSRLLGTSMGGMNVTRIAVLTIVAALPLLGAERIPPLKAKTLDNRPISVPGDSKVAAYILMFGFSNHADKAFAAWDKLIAPVYVPDPSVRYVEMPILEGLPFFVKPMVLHGMRRVIKPSEQSRFAPLFMGEKQIRGIVKVDDANAAYIVVTTTDGTVTWQTHAAASEGEFMKLQAAVRELQK
jgi:hypothetical protein